MPDTLHSTAIEPLDAELVALAEIGRAKGLSPLPATPIHDARERIVAGNALCAAGPEVASVQDQSVPVQDGQIAVRIYSPAAVPAGTLVYLHGGGWITGELGYPDELCRFLARDAGLRVVSVDYRLAPEHPYPTPLDDAWAALLWAEEEFGGEGPLGIGGDSAGGNLAAAATLRAQHMPTTIDFQLLVYPVTDSHFARPSYRACATSFPLGRADLEYCFDQYAPDPAARATSEVSPLRAWDFAGLPPTVVVVAGHDPLHDEGVHYANRLRDADVNAVLMEFPRLCHGFLRFTGASAACRDARAEIVARVGELVGKTKQTTR